MNVEEIRSRFPILSRKVYGKDLVYLDNTATSQTPDSVVGAIDRMYTTTKANVHRGVFSLSQEATDLQEKARRRVARFIGAGSEQEIVFTRGTTEGINLVAATYADFLENGDEIIVTVMEHHANIVPWQLAGRRKRITLRPVPINADGTLNLDVYRNLFNERTRMVAVCHASNVLGTVNPVKEMTAYAHSQGVPVLIDGAQAVAHMPVDVSDIDADFYAFSSHKMYGPTGVGVLYGKRQWLDRLPPYQGGGEMISSVSFERSTWAELPFKFEAGTPDFVGIAALDKAIDFIGEVGGYPFIHTREQELLRHTTGRLLAEIPGIAIYGEAPDKDAIISFNLPGAHHYDVGMLLDRLGVAVRTGHHCAQPLMHALGIEGCVRASFAVYNTLEEADKFVDALKRVATMLS